MELQYRQAVPADLEELSGILEAAKIELRSHGIDQWDGVYPTAENFMTDITENTMRVGTVGGKIAVLYSLNMEEDEEYKNGKWTTENYRVLHRLIVNPEFQHQNIAGRTLDIIANDLKNDGIKAIRLDVFSKNPFALRLYEKHGFEYVGVANLRKGAFPLMENILF